MPESIELTISPETIQSKNQEIIQKAIEKILKNPKITRKEGVISISSDPEMLTLMTKEDSRRLRLEFHGQIDENNLTQYQIVEFSLFDLTREVANRSHKFKTTGARGTTLHIEGSVGVDPSLKRLGIGSALMAQDNSLRLAVAKLIQKFRPISEMEEMAGDATSIDDKGWTSRKFQKKFKWKQISNGVFVKTTKIRSLPGFAHAAEILRLPSSPLLAQLKKRE